MIKSVTIKKGERGLFTNKLYIKGGKPRTFEFTDGVNVITGRNGCGKSVLLNTIKTLCGIGKNATHAVFIEPFQINKSLLGEERYTYSEYYNRELENKGYPKATLDWDGNITHHLTPEWFNPKNLWNVLDNPFPNKGQQLFGTGEVLGGIIGQHSSGEGGIFLLMKLLKLITEYPRYDKSGMNDRWVEAIEIYDNWVDSMPKDGKPTLLIDELDDRLDLDNQKTYWEYINHLTKVWQVIVVSHSYFAFKQENVNHIPLSKSYFNKVKKL